MSATLPRSVPPKSRWGRIILWGVVAIALTLLSGLVWTKLAGLIEK